MKSYLALLVAFLLAATPCFAQGPFNKVCRGMATLAPAGGKGFLWQHNRIVTANHVAAIRTSLLWDVADGNGGATGVSAKFKGFSTPGAKGFGNRDLKLLEHASIQTSTPLTPVTKGCEPPAEGEILEVWEARGDGSLAGRCRTHRAKLINRTSKSFRIKMLDPGSKVVGGMSGSPVLFNGQVIGVLTRGKNRQGAVEAISDSVCKCNQAASLSILNDRNGPKCTN